jgi:hypothetical protein
MLGALSALNDEARRTKDERRQLSRRRRFMERLQTQALEGIVHQMPDQAQARKGIRGGRVERTSEFVP